MIFKIQINASKIVIISTEKCKPLEDAKYRIITVWSKERYLEL